MYESPVIKFEKITFFEKIACDDCWSNKSFNFDNPFTGKKEQYPITITPNNNCGHYESRIAIKQVLSYLSTGHDKKYKQYLALVSDKNNTGLEGFSSVSS